MSLVMWKQARLVRYIEAHVIDEKDPILFVQFTIGLNELIQRAYQHGYNCVTMDGNVEVTADVLTETQKQVEEYVEKINELL